MKNQLLAAALILINAPVAFAAEKPPSPICSGSTIEKNYNSYVSENTRLTKELTEVTAERDKYKAKKSKSSSRSSSTDTSALTTQVNELQKQLKDQNAQIVAQQAKINAEQSQRLSQANQANAEINKYQSELSSIKAKPVIASPSFEAENRALKAQVATLQSELTTQRAKPAPHSYDAENKVLKAQLENAQSDLVIANTKSQNTSTAAQSSAKAQNDVLQQLRNENVALQSALKIEQDKRLVNPYQSENTAMKRELEQTKLQLASAQAAQAKTPTAEQDNQRGLQLFSFGDYANAFPLFRRASDKDHPGAITNLAMMYMNGYGVEPSLRQTEALLKRASALGSSVASENLAKIYQNGLGVGFNPAKAIQWYQIAAKQGSPTAREQLRLLGAKEGV